jgi:hypothetical protein
MGNWLLEGMSSLLLKAAPLMLQYLRMLKVMWMH